jgi:hypothetical protein
VWWISYRGESGHGVDNIGVFEDDGSPRKRHPLVLDPSPAAHPLHIARGFLKLGDDLYIANAWRKDSHIARYRKHGDTYRFVEVLAKTEHVAAMVHPFDVALGDDGLVYVSCQDTNAVVALVPETSTPAPVAPHLRKKYPKGNFLPGTFVASSHGRLPEYGEHRALDVPPPQGLAVVLDKKGKPRHSVRGIVVHRKHLYVADEAGDAVKVFALKTGEHVARIKGRGLEAPVHLFLHGEILYIGAAGTGSILAVDLASTPLIGKIKPRVVVDEKLDAPSGFAVGPDGDLYVAERKKQRVRRFSIEGKKKGTFIDDLPDMPEFLEHVPSGS